MKIIVCIKQVPDTTEVKLDQVTGTLIRDGVPSIVNPDDKAALEAALSIKDKDGSHVTVLTMGPPQADSALRECLAMGADEAVLLTDRVFGGSDTWATSSTIAAAIKNMDYDVIFAGRQAIDGDTAQVGSQIAEHIGIPQVSYVEEIIETKGDTLVIKRQFEDRYQIIEAKAPVLLTCLSEMNKPRYMSVAGIYDAYKEKTITTWTHENIKNNVDPANLGLKGSPTRVKKSFTKPVKAHGELHEEITPDEAVELIIDKLKSKHII